MRLGKLVGGRRRALVRRRRRPRGRLTHLAALLGLLLPLLPLLELRELRLLLGRLLLLALPYPDPRHRHEDERRARPEICVRVSASACQHEDRGGREIEPPSQPWPSEDESSSNNLQAPGDQAAAARGGQILRLAPLACAPELLA